MPASLEPAQRTYDLLAPHYDALTADHDYSAYGAIITGLLREHGLARGRVLDAACGTGRGSIELLRHGYQAEAFDISPGMLAAARRKPELAQVDIFQADLRTIEVEQRFDAAVCLDDAMNYLLSAEDLSRAFAALHQALRPGGLLIFDLNTLATFHDLFAAGVAFSLPLEGARWQGVSTRIEPGQHAAAEVALPSAGPRVAHQQSHHPVDEVRRLLGAAGYRVLAARGLRRDGSQEPVVDETRDSKVIFVARTGASTRQREVKDAAYSQAGPPDASEGPDHEARLDARRGRPHYRGRPTAPDEGDHQHDV